MKVECIRCQKNGPVPNQWHATGRIVTGARGLKRAVVKCDRCGYEFTSGVKEALDAAAAERGDCEVTPPEVSAPAPIPQPALLPAAPPKQQGFVTPAELAKHTNYARFLDRKRGA